MSTVERWHKIFNGDGGDYEFTMSHIGLSGHDAHLTYDRGAYTLTQQRHVVTGDSVAVCVLRMIAARLEVTL